MALIMNAPPSKKRPYPFNHKNNCSAEYYSEPSNRLHVNIKDSQDASSSAEMQQRLYDLEIDEELQSPSFRDPIHTRILVIYTGGTIGMCEERRG